MYKISGDIEPWHLVAVLTFDRWYTSVRLIFFTSEKEGNNSLEVVKSSMRTQIWDLEPCLATR